MDKGVVSNRDSMTAYPATIVRMAPIGPLPRVPNCGIMAYHSRRPVDVDSSAGAEMSVVFRFHDLLSLCRVQRTGLVSPQSPRTPSWQIALPAFFRMDGLGPAVRQGPVRVIGLNPVC